MGAGIGIFNKILVKKQDLLHIFSKKHNILPMAGNNY